MLVVIIRDGNKISLKTNFLLQFLKINSKTKLLFVTRNEQIKFKEIWCNNSATLATSTSGILWYYLFFIFMKSPKDFHDGIIRRLLRKKHIPFVRYGNFITVLSQALFHYFSRSARTDTLLQLLRRLNSKTIFVIDEFFSLNVADLRILRKFGLIIYVSSDLAYNFYGDNIMASKLMYNFEQKRITHSDLVIACSERDKLKYLELGTKNITYYPNVYPLNQFKPEYKEKIPSIVIVLKEYWGLKAKKAIEETFKAFSYINRKIKVYLIGIKPEKIPKNIELTYYDHIPDRLDFLKLLSKSWIGINLGIHSGGSNQRKYDYAIASLIVLSDNFGVRGDFLPHEYSYIDYFDLAAKIKQLILLDKNTVTLMGVKNREYALFLAKKKREELSITLTKLISSRLN